MDFSLDFLPSEIIRNIFNYLSLGDLLTCGQTCKRWNTISQDNKFLKKIEITFDSMKLTRSNRDIKFWLKSERKILNLSLKSIDFNAEDDEEFWIRFGRDLTYLSLVDCQVSICKIVVILKHLPNLESLELNRMEMFEDLFDISASPNLRELDCLNGFLDNIKTLDIKYDILSDIVFSKLIELMPNIENLVLVRNQESPSDKNDISWNLIKHFIIKQEKKLKTLSIHGWAWNEETFYELSQIKTLDLEVLEIVVCFYKSQDEQKLSTFLKTQKNLKILKISSQYLLDCHLATISNSLKKLELLEFSGSNQVTEAGVSELYKLTNLKSIGMWCVSEAIIDGMKKNFAKFKNDNLVKLEFNIYSDIENIDLNAFIDSVCKLYRNLTTLTLGMNEVNDVNAQSIIENLPWLRVLDMRRCSELTDYGLTGIPPIPEVPGKIATGFSISRLKGLKHLRIFNSENITIKSFVEIAKCKELLEIDLECTLEKLDPLYLNSILIQCGSLENLHIRNRENIMVEDSKKVTKNIPRLKTYSIV